MTRPRLAQGSGFRVQGTVLVETTLAAAGLIAIAFMVARIGLWLNDSMVTRNDHFQDSRLDAGSSQGMVRVAAVPGIHLIGPTADSAGAVGAQPPGPSISPPPSCQALTDAASLRLQALHLMQLGVGIQGDINNLHSQARDLIIVANQLAWDAIRVAQLRELIAGLDAQLNEIHNRAVVQGTGDHFIPIPEVQQYRGLHQIDERVDAIEHQLNPNVPGTVAHQIALHELRSAEITGRLSQVSTRLNEIYTTLYWDADGPGGPIPYGTGVFARISELQTAFDDPTGCGGNRYLNQLCSDIYDEIVEMETLRDDLRLERDGNGGSVEGLVPEQTRLTNEQQIIQNVHLPPLYALRTDLVGELNELQPLDNLVNGALGLHAQKYNHLNEVDDIVNQWESLWQQLQGSELAPDLSQKFQTLLDQYDNQSNNNPALGEPDLLGDLMAIILRLWWMARNRLDLADSAQESIVPLPPEAQLPPIPDNIFGKYDQANQKVGELVDYADQIRDLIKQAEDLEAQARDQCASGSD